ncbi:hypothetical protein Q3G72_029644 [Acer saccharum]|nr:hypothetical protein Q3G72_029644 [Acer saccharum]
MPLRALVRGCGGSYVITHFEMRSLMAVETLAMAFSEFLNREIMQVIVSGILRVQNSKGSVIFKDGGWIHKIVMSLRK